MENKDWGILVILIFILGIVSYVVGPYTHYIMFG